MQPTRILNTLIFHSYSRSRSHSQSQFHWWILSLFYLGGFFFTLGRRKWQLINEFGLNLYFSLLFMSSFVQIYFIRLHVKPMAKSSWFSFSVTTFYRFIYMVMRLSVALRLWTNLPSALWSHATRQLRRVLHENYTFWHFITFDKYRNCVSVVEFCNLRDNKVQWSNVLISSSWVVNFLVGKRSLSDCRQPELQGAVSTKTSKINKRANMIKHETFFKANGKLQSRFYVYFLLFVHATPGRWCSYFFFSVQLRADNAADPSCL